MDKLMREYNDETRSMVDAAWLLMQIRRILNSDVPDDVKEEAIAEQLGLKPQIEVIDDVGAYLEKRAQRAGLIAPCINPYCTTNNGQPATVDRRKKKSGACCKACMSYVCTHPACVKKAADKGWKHYTHPWGTKIAEEHKEYRERSDV